MNPRLSLPLAALLVSAPTVLRAQEWNDDRIVQFESGYRNDDLRSRMEQIATLLPQLKEAFNAIVARVHGDHREYLLKIERLLSQLSDPQWKVREEAERTLIDVGARAQELISQRVENYEVLEESIRCRRIIEAIEAKGRAEEIKEENILRGLVAAALYMDTEPRMLRALRSALGHTHPLIVDGAIRALGAHGGDDEADPVFQMIEWKSGIYRQAALGSVARMQGARAHELCAKLLESQLTRGEQCLLLRMFRLRTDAADLIATMQKSSDPVIAAAAKLAMPADDQQPANMELTLPDQTKLTARFLGLLGDAIVGAEAFAGLPRTEFTFAETDVIGFPDHPIAPVTDVRLFLTQGSLVTGQLVSIDEQSVKLTSRVFGMLTIARGDVQGIAIDPQLDRLVGASVEHDRVRRKNNELVDGKLLRVDAKQVELETEGGKVVIPINEVAGLLTMRPRAVEPDPTVYSRIDLTNGDRIVGFIAGSTKSHLAITAPLIGAAVVPVASVNKIELGVGGGAMWGFTLIADYSDNRIVEVDDQGRITDQFDDIFGAWDAECLDNGNLLITEFSVSRVQEIDRKTRQPVWVFEDLKNPYDADRLPNGNTLIADTFASRVIEVNKEGQIVWKYDKEIRPFDCDRLANGNTLIADVLKDRVIEVSPDGEIVWEVKGMSNVHDADRLPNGNTLITLRSKGSVIEVDRDGKVVWELDGLQSPSDADRLPNGHTLVAENAQVREFDRRGNVVWKKEMTWAVEVNRY